MLYIMKENKCPLCQGNIKFSKQNKTCSDYVLKIKCEECKYENYFTLPNNNEEICEI